MANPTTNFGWVMPTSTSLVTNLPADFNTFGQGVDTSMAQLKGGTTGQILSKTSATDMAFTWITPNPGDITGVTAGTGISGGGTSGDVTITNSMATAMTTKGDLVPATGSGTFSRLAVGTNGQTLVADSTASTGLKWATASSGALTKITSSTFTNSASVTIDSVFSSTYKSYMVILSLFSVSVAADDLLMQMRYGGTTATANYLGSQFMYNRNNSLSTGGYTNLAQATLSTSISTSGTPTVLTMYFDQVGNTSERATWYGNGIDADTQAASVFAGVINAAQTYDGFLIKGSSVNITGRYAVYGLAN